MGMAHFMGLLCLPTNYEATLPPPHPDTTQPSSPPLTSPSPPTTMPSSSANAPTSPSPNTPSNSSSPDLEARKHLECTFFVPVHYKFGHAYEFAQLPPAPDSLVNQQGEI